MNYATTDELASTCVPLYEMMTEIKLCGYTQSTHLIGKMLDYR